MCAGNQTCASDGSGYSECTCGSGSAGAAGASGSGGGSNGGAAGSSGEPGDPLFPIASRPVGAPCTQDSDCPVGPNGETPLICITPTSTAEFGTGAPQGGYCTAVCEDAADSADCQAIDGLAICGLLDDTTGLGYCIGICQPGDDQNAVKCNPNRAQACFQAPQDPTFGACFPVCQSDAACGSGQFCDLGAQGLGLCVTTAPAGGDIGAPCTDETMGTDCKSGICVTLLDPVTEEPAGSFCSANCTFGLIEGCGFDENVPAGTRESGCVLTQADDGGGGDLGFCFELCNEDADCAQEDWICTPGIPDQFGRTGACVPAAFGGGDADAGVVLDAGN